MAKSKWEMIDDVKNESTDEHNKFKQGKKKKRKFQI